MNWNQKKVLVTGAGGFIGSHLVEKLVHLGTSVRSLIKYNAGSNWGLLELLPADVLQSVEVTYGDLRDADSVYQAVEGMDTIFHLGAIISIPYSYQNPSAVVETNTIGTLNVLNAASKYQISSMIHTSSSEVYGTALSVPIDEKHPLQGQSPYSASKIAADKLVESFHASYGTPVGTVRPFNTFGPRQSSRAIIPTIITSILTNKKVSLGSLHPTRDFTFVSDTVQGFIQAAESPDIIGEVVNLGVGKEISIGELANKIFTQLEFEPNIISDHTRIRPGKSEVERLLSNNAKAKTLIGWEPQVSLEIGLKKTIEWLEQHLSMYKMNMYNV